MQKIGEKLESSAEESELYSDVEQQRSTDAPMMQQDAQNAPPEERRGHWEQIDLQKSDKSVTFKDASPPSVIVNTAMIASASQSVPNNNEFDSIVPRDMQQEDQAGVAAAHYNQARAFEFFLLQTNRKHQSCLLGWDCNSKFCSLYNGGCAWMGYSLGEAIGRIFFAILWDVGGVQVDNVSLGLVGFIFCIYGIRGLFTGEHRSLGAFLAYVIVLSLIFFFRTLVWCAQGNSGAWIVITLFHNGLSIVQSLVFWKLYRWAEYFRNGGVYDAMLESPP